MKAHIRRGRQTVQRYRYINPLERRHARDGGERRDDPIFGLIIVLAGPKMSVAQTLAQADVCREKADNKQGRGKMRKRRWIIAGGLFVLVVAAGFANWFDLLPLPEVEDGDYRRI